MQAPIFIMKYKHYFRPIALVICVVLAGVFCFNAAIALLRDRQIEEHAQHITAIHWYRDTYNVFDGSIHKVDMWRDGTVHWNKGRWNEAPAPSIDPEDFHKLARQAVEAGFPDFNNQQIYHDRPVATDMGLETLTVIYKGTPITIENSSRKQYRREYFEPIRTFTSKFQQLAGYNPYSKRWK